MLSVIIIRLREGRSPFEGDKRHFSHRLVDLGMTKKQAVLTIYLATGRLFARSLALAARGCGRSGRGAAEYLQRPRPGQRLRIRWAQAMKRAKDSVHAPNSSPTGGLQRLLSLLSVGLIGAVLASSMLITGDSVSVSNGDTLPQILLILMAVLVASLAGWNSFGLDVRRRNDPLTVPVSRLPIALLSLAIGCLLLSTLSATFRADGRAAWNNFWHIVALLLFAMLTAQVTHRATMVRALVQLVILCAVFSSDLCAASVLCQHASRARRIFDRPRRFDSESPDRCTAR